MKHINSFNEGKSDLSMAKSRLEKLEQEKISFKEIKKKLTNDEFNLLKKYIDADDIKTLLAKPTEYSFNR